MRIDGAWRVCDDGIVRPVLRGEVRSAVGDWVPIHFLVDVAADRSVFTAGVLQALGIATTPAAEKLQGVGGGADSVIIATQIRLFRETGAAVTFDGQFAAFTDPAALDMSVLGRDITNLFGVLVDRPQDTICLVAAKHRCVVVAE
jgi:hypothetical protein